MLRKRTLLLFLLAFTLRLLLQGWDVGVTSSSSHPDERQVGFVTERARGWFADPSFYAYGSLHFHAIRAVATVTGMSDEIRGLIVSGRAISLLASMVAIFLGWLIATRAWGRRTGNIFLLIAAWVPLDLQQSHFATVEAHHSAWVMAALAGCFWLARSGRRWAAAAAGAAIGASLAVKVASLALGLPLVVAVAITVRGRRLFDGVRLLAIAGATAVSAFWLCQPWAFAHGRPPLSIVIVALIAAGTIELALRRSGKARLALLVAAVLVAGISVLQLAALVGVGGKHPATGIGAITLAGTALNGAYLEGVGNEIAMVVGAADVAYVRVYAHTLPVLYPLRELTLWGWGALLVIAAIAGGTAGARRVLARWRRWFGGRFNESSIWLAILLAWLIPMALRLSTLQVKFMRYWEPLVVPAALVAAWWLMRLRRPLRRRAIVATIAGTILWGMAYTWAFIEPHPHRTASEWLSPMLADGQIVAFEHWDEHIAINVKDITVDLAELPSYDLPESGEKVATWTGALARSDWVVLTSNRVYRTVLTNPERFAKTGRLYRLLLSGEAGFEVVNRVRRGPRVFGLRWPIQRADESFLNYEFPQVVILRRVADIDPEDLAERVERPLPFLEEMGYIDLERQFLATAPAVSPVPSGIRQFFDLTLWLLVFAALGLASWAVLLPILRSWPDAGVGLALTTGWVIPAWLLWMGSELGIWSVSPATATWLLLGTIAGGTVALVGRWSTVVALLHRRKAAIVAVLTVVAAVGALFLIVRAWNPAIFWGEKPMDFSFLNAFLRAPAWPPGEPWMAGMPLHYYYFGEVLAAFPILVAGCSPGVGYNLISATIPALFAAVLATVGLLLTRRRTLIAAGALPLLALLTGNLAWPWLIKTLREGNIFDFWWATSRVIPGFAIDEYPLWTTLFADLHGHFIAFPVLAMTLAWGWICVTVKDRKWIASAAICGVGAAVVVATNPWDLFILTTTLGIGVLAAAREPLRGLLRLATAGGFSVLAAAPFMVELIAGISAGAGDRGLFLTDADFAPAWSILLHFGLFLIPLAMLSLAILGRRFWIVLPTVSIGIIAGLLFRSTAAAFALAMTAVFVTVALRSRDRIDRLGWAMASLGMVAVAACERFTLIDRMNTIFKVYNGVWVLLAFALTAALLRSTAKRRRWLIAVWLPLQLVAIFNLPLGIAQGWKIPRISSPRPTLDGQAFLAKEDPQTWFLVRGLHGTARPGEVVAEAAGHYYSDYTRIAMHTGQPTVVGWDWHLKQRGQSPAEIAARGADLELLYTGRNRDKRRAVLDRYRVAWAVAARIERQRYEISDEDPLGDIPGVELFAEQNGAVLYRVLQSGVGGVQRRPTTDETPPAMSVVGKLEDIQDEIIRSIALGREGATAIVRGGAVVDLDLDAQREAILPAPPCDPVSAARSSSEKWVACRDATLWRFGLERWISGGRVPGTAGIAGDQDVWAWGSQGLWKFEGERNWRQIFAGPVTTAAAGRDRAVWSDGSRIWIADAGGELQEVGRSFDGVRALAWQRDVLWALDAKGLHRAASLDLPWQRVLDRTEAFVALAGHGSNLWLIRSDGVVFEPDRPDCPSPWESRPSSPTGSLREPRGIAVSPTGRFAVADTFNHRILWYKEDGGCLDSAGTEGAGPGEFNEPSGVDLAGDGSLAVADTWNGRVQVLRPNGVTEVFGRNLFGPRDLLWAPDGSLLVSDTGNRKLLRFTPPDWDDEVVARLPGPPVGLAWAGGLIAVAVPADGSLLLIDGSNGEVVRRIEIRCWNTGDQQEGYVDLLPSGELVVSSPHYGELWIVDPTEEHPQKLLRDDLPGVTAVALTPFGDLIASLTWEHRLVRVPLED